MKIPHCCILLVAAWARSTVADVIVDQEHVVPSNGGLSYYLDYPGDYMAQSFTVLHSGELAGVGVQVSLYQDRLGVPSPPIDDLHLKVVRTGADGFALIHQVLAAATISPSSLPVANPFGPGQITEVDLTNWHAQVNAGDRLAITLSSAQTDNSGPERGTNYLWWWSLHNPHPGGEFSIYSPQLYGPTPLRDIWLGGGDPTVDAGFRVTVNVIPEPSSLMGLLSLVAWLGVARRRIRLP